MVTPLCTNGFDQVVCMSAWFAWLMMPLWQPNAVISDVSHRDVPLYGMVSHPVMQTPQVTDKFL